MPPPSVCARCGITDAVAANYYDYDAAERTHKVLLLHLGNVIRDAWGAGAAVEPLVVTVTQQPGYKGAQDGDPATHNEFDIPVRVPPVGGSPGLVITLHASGEVVSDVFPVRLDFAPL